jgi:pimeloyl-ACP methyl ester carboxylesterase
MAHNAAMAAQARDAMPLTQRGLFTSKTDLRAPWTRSGLPVVFHHGIGTNQDVWSDWLPVISPRHVCHRFDFRGFGQSVIPPEGHNWSLDEFIDDLMAVTDATGAERVHIVGESMGGTVALAAALRHPQRFASVTISNAAYKGSAIGRLPGWHEEIARDGMAAWAERLMGFRFAPGALDAERHRWYATEQARGKAHVILGIGDLLARTDLGDALPKLQAPLLILMPDGSPFVSVQQGVDIKARVPDAELAVFPGTRHGLPFSHGRECAERLLAFLDRIEGKAG